MKMLKYQNDGKENSKWIEVDEEGIMGSGLEIWEWLEKAENVGKSFNIRKIT